MGWYCGNKAGIIITLCPELKKASHSNSGDLRMELRRNESDVGKGYIPGQKGDPQAHVPEMPLFILEHSITHCERLI